MAMKNWFAELNAVDVSEHTEKKNGLTYLSWAWAWGELKKRYPLSYYTVYESQSGEIFFRDPIGAHVKTGVTIVWEEEDGLHEHEAIEMLPVMDFKNKAVPADNIDCMQLNKTIQRSLTKAIARLGLGLYIYAGEDMPEEPEDAKKERADLQKKVDALVKAATASMDSTAKMEFAKAVIIPVIGTANYLSCNDTEKLKALAAGLEASGKKTTKKTAAA